MSSSSTTPENEVLLEKITSQIHTHKSPGRRTGRHGDSDPGVSKFFIADSVSHAHFGLNLSLVVFVFLFF